MIYLVALFTFLAAVVVDPAAQGVALGIAALVAAVSPVGLKFFKFDGVTMSAISYLAALIIAAIAEWLVGDFTLTRGGFAALFLGSSGLWLIQQAVYAALKQWMPATSPLSVRPAPAPSLPAPPAPSAPTPPPTFG